MQKGALRFKRGEGDEFIKTLRHRVNDYFQKNEKSPAANTEMHIKTIVLLTTWVSLYFLIILGDFSVGIQYLLWGLLGVNIALVATNIGHDAIHGAYSKNKFINKLLSHTFNINGASAYMWKKMHNVAHHTYTNVHGYDEDIESVPVLRLSPGTKLMKVHRFQQIYSFLFYTLATASWWFAKDYIKFFKNEVGNYSGQKHPRKEYFFLFFYKFINYAVYLVIPLLVIDLPWYHIIGGYALMLAFSGFYLAIVFMLAHVVEDTHFPVPDDSGSIENTWALHQMYTTANFAGKSRWAGYLTGGLNTQVEHHLFPNICSIHYRKIAKIVDETAAEYNVPYLDYPTFGAALKSHYRFLKKLGRQESFDPPKVIRIKSAA